MRYREAKLLKEGQEVIRTSDKAVLVVKEAFVFGQYKTVKIGCFIKDDEKSPYIYLINNEID
jgi:hypothetical protein